MSIDRRLMSDGDVATRFVGKTIAYIDGSHINETRFFFTDGTTIAIEAEIFVGGLAAMVARER